MILLFLLQISQIHLQKSLKISAKTIKNEAIEYKVESVPFSAGPQWTEVKKEFTPKFDKKELADPQDTALLTMIEFTLTPTSGYLYIDDVKIIEK